MECIVYEDGCAVVPLKRTSNARFRIQIKGKSKDEGKWFTRVVVQFIVGIDGNIDVELKEAGAGLDGATAQVRVPAP